MSLPSYPGAISISAIKSFLGGAAANDLNSFHSNGSYTPPNAVGYPLGTATTVPASGAISLGNFQGLGDSPQRLTGINRLYGNQSNGGYAFSVDLYSRGLVLNAGTFGSYGWTDISFESGGNNYGGLTWNTLTRGSWVYLTNVTRDFQNGSPARISASTVTLHSGPLINTVVNFPYGCWWAAYLSGRTVFIAMNQQYGQTGPDAGTNYASGQMMQAFNDTCPYTYEGQALDAYGNPKFDAYHNPVMTTYLDHYTYISW